MAEKKLNVLDLFCGCGGISEGFKMAGYNIIGGVDFNKDATDTFAKNFEGAKVVCEVKRPLVKGETVLVFKKKRRKGYRRLNGHRQYFTQVVIKDVIA